MKRKVATDAPALWRPYIDTSEVSDTELQGILKATPLPFKGDRDKVRKALTLAKNQYLSDASIQRFPAPGKQRKALAKIEDAANDLLEVLGYEEHEEKDGNILRSLPPAIQTQLETASGTYNPFAPRDRITGPLSIIEIAVGVAALRDCARRAHTDKKEHDHHAALARLINDLKLIFREAFDRSVRGDAFNSFAIAAASLLNLTLSEDIIRKPPRKTRPRKI